MSKRKIVRTSVDKPNPKKEEKEKKLMRALQGFQEMNDKLTHINEGLKENTNKMVDEIGRCLDDIFIRLGKVETFCGIGPHTEFQTNDVQTEETATSIDTMEMLSNDKSLSPSVEESLAQ
jgi:uncharacterized coiled-coil DUF342 family protein